MQGLVREQPESQHLWLIRALSGSRGYSTWCRHTARRLSSSTDPDHNKVWLVLFLGIHNRRVFLTASNMD